MGSKRKKTPSQISGKQYRGKISGTSRNRAPKRGKTKRQDLGKIRRRILTFE
jgi:hypothetical protein